MKKRIQILLLLFLIYGTTAGQFIDEIIEYRPAPGQFINTSAGNPGHAESIRGEDPGLISLGAVGGYIVFRFDKEIVNHEDHPYGVDFTLFGNVLPDWSEPGSVYVMKDENHNAKADDNWYLLAGSDYHFTTTKRGHEITYYKPENEHESISWKNNLGESSIIEHNDFHMQGYYPDDGFDTDFYQDSCRFLCTVIAGNLVNTEMGVKSYAMGFGYADNLGRGDPLLDFPDNPYTPEKEGYGGDGFDLHWAVDSHGNYIDLDTAHFVKVQTSMYGSSVNVGEISTELKGGRLSSRNSDIGGTEEMILIEDPGELSAGEHQLKAYYFKKGRYYPNEEIMWTKKEGQANLSAEGVVSLSGSEELTLIATARSGEVQSRPLHLKLRDVVSRQLMSVQKESEIKVFPNPAGDFIRIRSLNEGVVSIMDLQGKVFRRNLRLNNNTLDISDLPKGIYVVISRTDQRISRAKFIKY